MHRLCLFYTYHYLVTAEYLNKIICQSPVIVFVVRERSPWWPTVASSAYGSTGSVLLCSGALARQFLPPAVFLHMPEGLVTELPG